MIKRLFVFDDMGGECPLMTICSRRWMGKVKLIEVRRMKLNLRAFALTCGIVWAVGLFCLTWWIMLFEGATRERTCLGRLYRGYNISPLGSVIGLVYGFFDALSGGALFAWLYNKLTKRLPARAASRS